MTDPGRTLADAARKIVRPLTGLLAVTDPREFDEKFTAIEGDILAWKTAFVAIDKANLAQMNLALASAQIILPVLGQVHQQSKSIGATKGQKMSVAPAAGGRRKTRRSTRKVRGRRR